MPQLTRRSLLSALLLSPPVPKLRIVAVGGHGDDPQTCVGGTLSLFADQGHDVVGLTLTGGPPPLPSADRQDRTVRNRLDAAKAAEILKIRLDCLNYSGGNMGQFRFGAAAELSGQRYKEFTELLLDKYNPHLVFTHWPIDVHMDHRAASNLTYNAWLQSGKRFALYYMEAELGVQTQNFFPTHYVDTTAVGDRYHQAFRSLSLWYDEIWPLHDRMRRQRGAERGCLFAEAFNHHPQSPTTPLLP